MRKILALFVILSSPLYASELDTPDVYLAPYEGSFDDATFSVESAIVDRGLVVDHVSHVGEMLERTAQDVGADEQIFNAADVYLFCSAVVSRMVMELNPLNVAYCPYNIFVIENDNGVQIGYRNYPEGEMDLVEELLADIVADAQNM